VVQLVHTSNIIGWFLLILTTCSHQVGSLPSVYSVSVQQHIGTMLSFEDIDPAQDYCHDPELELDPEIDTDQEFSS
jgi:hypothetical protein